MRVVAGKFRAKKLEPPAHNIRPTLDKVKQALFTRLQFFVPQTEVLDLFCGSGALGIEALSRDAKKVIFCDVDPKSVKLTQKNLAGLKLENQEARVYKTDALKFLRTTKEKFDLIILDPPYHELYYAPAMMLIFERKLLKENGIIVCERLKNSPIFQDFFALETTKNYGTVSLDYFVWK